MTNTMKCLDCGNSSKFVVPYIDRTMVTYDEAGDVVDEYSVGYQFYDDKSIVCGVEVCGSNQLNIYHNECEMSDCNYCDGR